MLKKVIGKEVVQMSWTKLGFGRHLGKTLPQILFEIRLEDSDLDMKKEK